MKPFRNLIKILLPLLFIVNLYISFDHIISPNSLATNYNIELLITENQNENDITDFNQLKQSFSLYKPLVSYKKSQKFDYQIYSKNSFIVKIH